ncbi:MAG: helix-turn-helix transcriptional regulator [Actinomycetota bacterium]|nr:helix-turn-helix transcriptional regulator [Actinomycetota bacterium]
MAVASWDQLTAREKAVLAAVERRLSNGEIADELFISVRTVESHIASLRRKLEADHRGPVPTEYGCPGAAELLRRSRRRSRDRTGVAGTGAMGHHRRPGR